MLVDVGAQIADALDVAAHRASRFKAGKPIL